MILKIVVHYNVVDSDNGHDPSRQYDKVTVIEKTKSYDVINTNE